MRYDYTLVSDRGDTASAYKPDNPAILSLGYGGTLEVVPPATSRHARRGRGRAKARRAVLPFTLTCAVIGGIARTAGSLFTPSPKPPSVEFFIRD